MALHRLARDMTLQPHLARVALKRKPAARGTRAPRAPSIVDGFCQLPSQESVAGSVTPIGCPLVLAAARASPAAIGEDAQNDSRLATIPGELPGEATAALWPRYGEEAAAIPCRTVRFTRSIEAVFNRPEKPNPCRASSVPRRITCVTRTSLRRR